MICIAFPFVVENRTGLWYAKEKKEAFGMIAGLQKMTLLDYPGKVACTVFLQGCNFRCPFCHNSSLLGVAQQETIPVEELLAFLEKRQGILEGVCITGGEPTLHKYLPELLGQIKELGFAVKLDTNGYRPEVLQALIQQNLVDYVAMDIKNCPEKYGETAGVSALDLPKIEESMRLLFASGVAFEFRTTVVAELHTAKDFSAIGKWLEKLSPQKKAEKYFIQPYADRDSVLCGGLTTPKSTDLQAFLAAIRPHVHRAEIRGDVR